MTSAKSSETRAKCKGDRRAKGLLLELEGDEERLLPAAGSSRRSSSCLAIIGGAAGSFQLARLPQKVLHVRAPCRELALSLMLFV